jgi:hypothetical protein
MKSLHQSQEAAVQSAASWSPAAVQAMDIFLLTHPALDVQRWFEEQVVLHLGCSPHGRQVESSPIA